jgi:hypothetical protein
MSTYKVQIKRYEEYVIVVEVEADSPEKAEAIVDERMELPAFADRYQDALDRGYDQCYHECKVLP